MTDNELARYRGILERRAARLRGDIEGLNEEGLRPIGTDTRGNLSHVPLHPADLASDAFEQETSMALLDVQSQNLVSVNVALRRMDEGGYGFCERCGSEISRGRLDALPETTLCIDCAADTEERSPLIEPPGNL